MKNQVFTKALSVRGNLLADYSFEDEAQREAWLINEFVDLCKEYGELSYLKYNLDGLKVGDTCTVLGEGYDEFEILELVGSSINRPRFALDSGWLESVYKCYAIV